LGNQTVSNRQFRKNVAGFAEGHIVPGRANHDPPENIYRQDDDPRYGIAAHEFRCAIH
jgi:hypothetical protein